MSRPKRMAEVCILDGCESKAHCRDLCKRHYNRLWRHGDVTIGDPLQKFMSHVQKTDGCWLWTGFLMNRYGRASHHSKKVRAHRLAYELLIAPIPEGMHVLHKCDNPPCVNPAHLFLGTHLDNMRDMEAKGRAKWIQDNLRGRA